MLLLVAGEHEWRGSAPVRVLVLSVAVLLTPGRARPAADGLNLVDGCFVITCEFTDV